MSMPVARADSSGTLKTALSHTPSQVFELGRAKSHLKFVNKDNLVGIAEKGR